MEQENEVRISLDRYLELRCKAEQFDIITKIIFIITKIIFDNVKLNYDKTELYSADQQQLLDYLKIIKVEEYNAKLKKLTDDDQSNS